MGIGGEAAEVVPGVKASCERLARSSDQGGLKRRLAVAPFRTDRERCLQVPRRLCAFPSWVKRGIVPMLEAEMIF